MTDHNEYFSAVYSPANRAPISRISDLEDALRWMIDNHGEAIFERLNSDEDKRTWASINRLI